MWYLHDGWPVDGAHGRGEGSVERVVEDGRADVGHDGVQQRLTQVLFVGGHGRGRGRRLKGQETQTDAQTGVDPLKIRNERAAGGEARLTTAMSFFSFSKAISHFCSVFRGHL